MITFTLNNETRTVDADPDTPLLWVIRDEIGLTGTKFDNTADNQVNRVEWVSAVTGPGSCWPSTSFAAALIYTASTTGESAAYAPSIARSAMRLISLGIP